MPNHCETDLILKGKPALLAAVLAAVLAAHFTDSGEMNCDSIIPYPEEYKKLDAVAKEYEKTHPGDWANQPKDGFNQGGYGWRNSRWGTKWGTYNGFRRELNEKKTIARLSFLSAWSPPTPVLDKLAELYPGLTITAKSYERGCTYKVDAKWEKGEKVRELESDYRGNRGG